MNESEIFNAAARLPLGQRTAYLEQVCGENQLLRKEVESLLRAHDQGGSFLEPPAGDATRPFPPITEQPGTVVGPYKLLQQIGEGGMGVVYMAEQQHPVRRKVALKIIKPGMDTREVIARFESERQALALMEHLNIAKVFDAGATETGRPYFVMELVHGVPLTKYCDDNSLPPQERLELFVPVCQAIQHAHQKGIIHRDIKPSNILVALYDGKPVPKVIDFGVAKATEQRLTERTAFTRFGTIVGTLEYMSPEQAELSQLGVDTRSDIYSLGVVLYELLTGSTPLERKRLREVAFAEVLRLIREEEPPRPSTRLSESRDTLPSISAQRRTEPAKLTRLLRGELDWIVMKALEKDRARRYETASGLARDVERYLADEPVEACPPTAGYKLRKFASKNRKLLATVAGFAVVLVLGTEVSTWQAVRATTAQHLANDRLIDLQLANTATTKALEDTKQAKAQTERAKVRTEKALAESNEERRLAEAVSTYLVEAFQRPDPEQDGRDVKVVDVLDQAVAKLDTEFAGAPRVKGKLLDTLGRTYLALGLPEKAGPVFEKARAVLRTALGPDHVDTISCINCLARAYQVAGRRNEALPLCEDMLKLTKATLGPHHHETLISMNNLAGAYQDAGRPNEAVSLLEEAVKIGKATNGLDHTATLTSIHNLAVAYRLAGRLNEAIKLSEEALALARAKYGRGHATTYAYLGNLAAYYSDAGRLDKAIPLLEEVVTIRKAKLGLDHPATLTSMNNLATAYRNDWQLSKALPLLEETLKLRRAKLGSDHSETLVSMDNLAVTYGEAGRVAQAVSLSEEALELWRAKHGADHPDALVSMNILASLYRKARRLTEAVPLAEESLKLRTAKFGPGHPHTLSTMSTLAEIYETAGDLDKAVPLLEKTLELIRPKLGPAHPDTCIVMTGLARCYTKKGRHEQAEPLLRQLLAVDTKQRGRASLEVSRALRRLGLNLVRQRKFDQAATALRQALVIQEKKVPGDWTTFDTTSILGESLAGHEKYAEAEPLLLAAYNGLDKLGAKAPRQAKQEAIQRLIDLYQATGKPDEAAKWRKTLDALIENSAKPRPNDSTR